MNELSVIELDRMMTPLANKLYKSHYPAGKAKKNERLFACYQDTNIVGLARLKQIEDFQLLTGMLVLPAKRRLGVSSFMLEQMNDTVFSETTYCFSFDHLVTLYSKHGFVSIDESALPNSLKQRFERYITSGKPLIPMKFYQNASQNS